MKLDRNAIDSLMKLDDAALAGVIRDMARRAGFDPNSIPLDSRNLAAIRQALNTTSDEDLARAAQKLNLHPDGGQNGRNGG